MAAKSKKPIPPATRLEKLQKADLKEEAFTALADELADQFVLLSEAYGVMERVLLRGGASLLPLLLSRGVRPDALPSRPEFGGVLMEARALGQLFHPEVTLSDETRAGLCDLLLAHGADPDQTYPHPSLIKSTANQWGQQRSAVDMAFLARSAAVERLLVHPLADLTRASAWTVAVYATGYGTHTRLPLSDAQRRAGLDLLDRVRGSLGKPGHDRWGTSALHAAALGGNAEAVSWLLSAGADPSLPLAHDVVYQDTHFAPLTGGAYARLQFPEGASPLDVLDEIREYLSGRIEEISQATGYVALRVADLTQRLAALAEVEKALLAGGGQRNGAVQHAPAWAAPIDAVLRPLVGPEYDSLIAGLITAQLGPWGYLNAVGRAAGDRLDKLDVLTQRDPVAFVLRGMGRRERVALRGDSDARDALVVVDPQDYPVAAQAVLSGSIIGWQGGVLVLRPKDDGTHLYRVQIDRLEDLGTLTGGLLANFSLAAGICRT